MRTEEEREGRDLSLQMRNRDRRTLRLEFRIEKRSRFSRILSLHIKIYGSRSLYFHFSVSVALHCIATARHSCRCYCCCCCANDLVSILFILSLSLSLSFSLSSAQAHYLFVFNFLKPKRIQNISPVGVYHQIVILLLLLMSVLADVSVPERCCRLRFFGRDLSSRVPPEKCWSHSNRLLGFDLILLIARDC